MLLWYVSYLPNDNALLENKQKELDNTIQALLQSKEHVINAYQDELISSLIDFFLIIHRFLQPWEDSPEQMTLLFLGRGLHGLVRPSEAVESSLLDKQDVCVLRKTLEANIKKKEEEEEMKVELRSMREADLWRRSVRSQSLSMEGDDVLLLGELEVKLSPKRDEWVTNLPLLKDRTCVPFEIRASRKPV
ncbi:hypothetical protein KSS87_008081 [Heliosperma pusillum]|nr:hypothetical protein KSS87_008081 [Heliosperma pusillum]